MLYNKSDITLSLPFIQVYSMKFSIIIYQEKKKYLAGIKAFNDGIVPVS